MVKIKTFMVEQWMADYETTPGVINCAETCVDSISIDELAALSTHKNHKTPFDSSTRMDYGAILGSDKLRTYIAQLCSAENGVQFGPENVVVFQGAISANFMSLYTLVGPGDHVVCVYPTYQQLYALPESLGAEVSLWKLKEENGYVPNLEDLKSLIKSNTKMIIVNNPDNPTGAPIPTATLQSIADFAKEKNITLMSDEVYRPLFHSLPSGMTPPPSAITLGYTNSLVTGSMSKAFALAGLRIGWVVSPSPSIIESIAHARDYSTIAVSKVDDQLASFALSPAVQPALLERNLHIAKTNLTLVTAFVEKYGEVVSWHKPSAGTTTLLKFRNKNTGELVKDTEFCLGVLKETKVLLVPGSHCFGDGKEFEGTVRLGYACSTEELEKGLRLMGEYIERHLL